MASQENTSIHFNTCDRCASLTHRVVLEVLTEDLWSNPALGPWNPGPSTETVTSHRQLLTQAEVGDHGPDSAVCVRHGYQNVVGLQVSVD